MQVCFPSLPLPDPLAELHKYFWCIRTLCVANGGAVSPRSLPVKVKIYFLNLISQCTCFEKEILCEQKAQLNIRSNWCHIFHCQASTRQQPECWYNMGYCCNLIGHLHKVPTSTRKNSQHQIILYGKISQRLVWTTRYETLSNF